MNLDDVKQINKIDPGRVAESIRLLPEQLEDALAQAEAIKIPADYRKIDRVVINGMGGSNLGAHLLLSVFKEELKIPLMIEPGYQVPGYVDKNTLYVISSYSGNTEEPLSVYREVKKRGAKIFCLTAAGERNKLAELMRREKISGLVFTAELNPSRQPRLAVGYSSICLLVLLEKLGVISVQEKIDQIISVLEKNNGHLIPAIAVKKNPAKNLAAKIFGREVVLVGAEFLEGGLHILRNQFCETGKNFADYLVLPDLNHYALEGLSYPRQNKKNLFFIFFSSGLYRGRIKKRLRLTEEIVAKNGLPLVIVNLKGKTRLAAAAELLQFGSWVTFYLAMLNGVNPSAIAWVDWFKKRLA
ncbi:MAG TPA: SIS domain-containing protein [Candidatus Methylomirabilis sp.]|nr:SIS domain-containing protein [Candidatus Methylomirabilis sp.]